VLTRMSSVILTGAATALGACANATTPIDSGDSGPGKGTGSGGNSGGIGFGS